MNRTPGTFCWMIVLLSVTCGLAFAGDPLEINWFTIDGGGAMNSTDGQPGGFELSGTIGQADANPSLLTGGDFELTGGFWPVARTAQCACRADLNNDGVRIKKVAIYEMPNCGASYYE